MGVSLSTAASAAVAAAHAGADGTREVGGIQAIKDLFVGMAPVEWLAADGALLATQSAALTVVGSCKPARLRIETDPTTWAFVAEGTATTVRLKTGGTAHATIVGVSLDAPIVASTTGITGVFWLENLPTLDSPIPQTVINGDSSAWTNRGVALMLWFNDSQVANYPELLDPATGNPYALQQVNVLTRWPNGKPWLVMAFFVVPSLAAGATLTPKIRDKTTSNNTPLTVSQMLATGFDFDCEIRLDAGGAGLSAKARTMLAALSDATLAANTAAWSPDSAFYYQGPLCTVIRLADHTGKSYDIGAESVKSVRPWFIAWFWAHDNSWDVRPCWDTCDSEKAQTCTYDLKIYLGNTSPALAFSQSGHVHYFDQKRTLVFGKGNARPKIGLKPNVIQMAAALVLPQYDPTKSLSSTARNAITTGWASADKTLGGAGLWGRQMGAVAARPEIGPITHWDAAWIYDGGADIRDIVERNLDLAGSWQMWHRCGGGTRGGSTRYYDELNGVPALGRWQSRDAYPKAGWVSYGPAGWASPDTGTVIGSTTTAPVWSADTAHQPSMGGVAFLIGGDPYYLDQCIGAFGFNINYLFPGTGTATPDPWAYQSGRDTKDTPFNHEQVRSNGWDLRTRHEVALLAPDGMPEKALAIRCINNGFQAVNGKVASSAANGNAIHDFFYGQRPANFTPQTLGYMAETAYNSITHPEKYPQAPDSKAGMAAWMHHFWTTQVLRCAEVFGTIPSVAQAAGHFPKFARDIATGRYPQGGIEYIYPATLTSTGDFAQSHPQAVASDAACGAKAWNWPDAQTTDQDGYRNQYSASIAMGAMKSADAWKAWVKVLKPNVFDVCDWGGGLKYCIIPKG
jgi:hypothetical protein